MNTKNAAAITAAQRKNQEQYSENSRTNQVEKCECCEKCGDDFVRRRKVSPIDPEKFSKGFWAAVLAANELVPRNADSHTKALRDAIGSVISGIFESIFQDEKESAVAIQRFVALMIMKSQLPPEFYATISKNEMVRAAAVCPVYSPLQFDLDELKLICEAVNKC